MRKRFGEGRDMLTGTACHFQDTAHRRQTLLQGLNQRRRVAQRSGRSSASIGRLLRLLKDVSRHGDRLLASERLA